MMRTTSRLLQLHVPVILLLLLLLLQATGGRAFLFPIPGRPPTTTTTTTKVLSSSSTTPASSKQPLLLPGLLRLRFEGFDPQEGAAAGDTITVVYDPRAAGLDAPIPLPLAEDYDDLLHDSNVGGQAATAAAAKAPCLLFGFDGWDGSDRPFVTPLFPGEEEDTWAASVHLPNFARVLTCAVSDGDLEFDTNGGLYFHLRVTHIQRLAADGVTIETCRQGEDGTVVSTGVLEMNDAQELERMVEEELARRRSEGPAAARVAGGLDEGFLLDGDDAEGMALGLVDTHEPAALDDDHQEVEEEPEFMGGVEARLLAASGASAVALSPQAAERAGSIQQLRGEASVMGERLGLSSIVVNDVREAFEFAWEGTPATYEGPGAALLDVGALGLALARLGLEGFNDPGEAGALCERVLGHRGGVGLEGLMRLFAALDEEDCGISIV